MAAGEITSIAAFIRLASTLHVTTTAKSGDAVVAAAL
jgi:hypothetical protein